ncbi:hypothetical protein THASP1DRAFT_20441 [Thamnocephalis sphaerospora]|uniref:Alpha/Beta hydrolase protein n=1 Tax=Thamnocephalis sphaerospora TaxID=78915 RepID=A0A4P9XI70_9FUNG|nr:hypothetical protein THASP1DRAFT_20441 [Thamnocephalis sphaerospora]|eukprot:RKP04970.1 hypothetical protein THASP1DRAFT_20441 [Thamnocephalis sphaerospora]
MGAYAAYLTARGLRMATPASAVAALGVDFGANVARLAWQYRQADRHARERADELRAGLLALRQRYQTVRVVAHSLGCRHILEALHQDATDKYDETVDLRPDWLHLCAPACAEQDVQDVLSMGAARRNIYVYYTDRDAVLTTLFRAMHPEHSAALGAVGPSAGLGAYPGLVTYDASDAFTWRVHTAYAKRFYSLALPPG